jgi:hypothetical protein
VLNIAPCTDGPTRYWVREGAGIALPYHQQLVSLSRRAAAEEPQLGARPRVSRYFSGAMRARIAGFPAITIGGDPLPHDGPPSEAAMSAALEFALALCEKIDEAVEQLADVSR